MWVVRLYFVHPSSFSPPIRRSVRPSVDSTSTYSISSQMSRVTAHRPSSVPARLPLHRRVSRDRPALRADGPRAIATAARHAAAAARYRAPGSVVPRLGRDLRVGPRGGVTTCAPVGLRVWVGSQGMFEDAS
jgi:hypothetical protein